MLGIVFSPENLLVLFGGGTEGETPAEPSYLLMEDDSNLLLEDGDKILLQG